MKVAIVGANGSIGSAILRQVLLHRDITSIVAITRNPLPSSPPPDPRLHNALISDFSNLDSVPETTWSHILTADALIWAVGTYDYNEDVNLHYPLAFQEQLAKRLQERAGANGKFRFILLGGAFVEPDQQRWLYFLGAQRRLKGVLQTRTLKFAEANSGSGWEAYVIRPGGILMGGDTYVNSIVEFLFGGGLAIRGEELSAFVAELAVSGSERHVIENREMTEVGRRLLAERK
ncbi:hypothetical protein ST47_g9895 [Ascochyta rabiei]|uniref:Uncharacterized protein n=1 Tax=Didymella rabiei TaxID=5454 RepID=A0A162WDH0_DIDRA|nr:hypothetical protein ST47_g9895 [Ascochyta rabiei]